MKWPFFPWKSSYRWQYPFHIALWASQFRVWNRYHIMTPAYVSVIYFYIRSLVRHPPNTSIGCFRLALFGKPRHRDQSECSSLIGWFFDMVYFQQWSVTESKTPHVTLLGRSIFIISTKQNHSQFSWTVPSYSFVSNVLWLWWHREGFHLSPSWLVTKRTKWFCSLSEQYLIFWQ